MPERPDQRKIMEVVRHKLGSRGLSILLDNAFNYASIEAEEYLGFKRNSKEYAGLCSQRIYDWTKSIADYHDSVKMHPVSLEEIRIKLNKIYCKD